MTTPTLILAREMSALGMKEELRRWHDRGEVTRLRRGVYVRTSELAPLSADARYRLEIQAVSEILPDTQFSRDSAAAMWRLPSLRDWPTLTHASTPPTPGGRSGALVARHAVGLDPNPVEIDGVSVTSLVRTLAEVACDRSFARAVTFLDAGLSTPREGDFRWGTATPSQGDIAGALDALTGIPGRTRGNAAIEFADGLSQSPGESLSRVQIHALGLPAPELQVSFHDDRGHIGDVDFYWPHLGLVGEFDGDSKYGAHRRFARHLSVQQLVIEEKRREDRLRRVVGGVVRWDWSVALDRRLLASRLASHGLVASRAGVRWPR
mgnify:CR=1 FL=1